LYSINFQMNLPMTRLILIRHAQASFGSSNYDQLSSLGHQQSSWLGQHLEKRGLIPNSIICGTLTRHRETVNGILEQLNSTMTVEQNRDWNEFEFKKIIEAFLLQHPEMMPSDKSPKSFFSLLKKSMLAWSHNELGHYQGETWLEFESRIIHALSKLQTENKEGTVWLVSSGGAIAMLLKQVLEVSNQKMIDLNFQIHNSSMTDIYLRKDKVLLSSFNQVPHLDHQERLNAITYA